jgi:hypothetical protein
MKQARPSRRTVVAAAGGIAAALGAAALGLTLPRWLGRRYAPTPYDDLLGELVDRDQAARLGAVARGELPTFSARAAARELRQRFEQRNLAEVLDADIREGRIAEVGGWLLPDSLAQLCTLAVS